VIGKSGLSPSTHTSLITPALTGPYGAGIFDPRSWANNSTDNHITIELTRVVLAIGVFAVGVELPKAYMLKHWKSLLFLLIPVMTYVRGTPILPRLFPTLIVFPGVVCLRWAHLCPHSQTRFPLLIGRCCVPHTHRSHPCRSRGWRQICRKARPSSYQASLGSRVWLQRWSCVPILIHFLIPYHQRQCGRCHCPMVPGVVVV
jgi:hypothetical protein